MNRDGERAVASYGSLGARKSKEKMEMGQKVGGERDKKSECVDEIDVARRRGRSLAVMEA